MIVNNPLFWPNLSREIRPIGFGCCPMGMHGWGAVEEGQLVAAVQTALDLGITFFDTADIYGLGVSEIILGKALGSRRKEAFVATKFGVRYDNGRSFNDTSPEWINRAIEGSLKRLNVDAVDLYQMHYWDGTTPIEETIACLQKLVDEGKIRTYGVTNFDPFRATIGNLKTTPASYSFHYSLVHREHEREILEIQQKTDYIFLSWGSLGQGVLSGKYSNLDQLDASDRRRRPVYQNFHGTQFDAIQKLLEEMRRIAPQVRASSLTQLALRWILDRVPRSIAMVGIKRPEQITDAAGALALTLSPEVLARLNEMSSRCSAVPASP